MKMKKDPLAEALKAVSAGMEIVVSTLMGGLLGYVAGGLLDATAGYIGMIIGLLLGFALGIYGLYRKYG